MHHHFHLSENIDLELRPTLTAINDNLIGDYDIGILMRHKYISFEMGYRWMLSENESLHGPYIGISLRYHPN